VTRPPARPPDHHTDSRTDSQADPQADPQAGPRTARWREALELVRQRGYERRAEPFRLASGEESLDYVDAKHAIDTGERLRAVSEAVAALAAERGMDFTAVGGLTMGADPLAHGIALVTGCTWFAVRKEPKTRGREAWIEGGRLAPHDRVLLVDDVVTTGGSILQAYERVRATGAAVVGAIPILDRGDAAGPRFAALGVRYAALLTYADLGIEPVGVRTPPPAGP
jgi:orotate phosphoribosyltransferase